MISVRLLTRGYPVDWRKLTELTGADAGSIPRLELRDRIPVLLTGEIPSPAASILKQCMLSGGADALVHREVLTCRVPSSRAVIYGTPASILRGCDSLRGQPFGLNGLAGEIRLLLADPVLPGSIEIGGRKLAFGKRPLIMGILNVTPDSFSDGGSLSGVGPAVERALEMADSGASVIDIGGESTRPGARPVPAGEQMERVIPVIHGIREVSAVPVSIDTTLPEVASAALDAGAGMINSVNAMETPGIAETAAELEVPVCLMHMRGTPANMQDSPEYRDPCEEISDYLLKAVERVCAAGVKRERVLVDPGMGFGKTLEHNLELLGSLEWLAVRTGCRVLLGHSRKSFLGAVTGIDDPGERDCLTHIATVLVRGADMVRVHDVRGTTAALDLAERMGVFQ